MPASEDFVPRNRRRTPLTCAATRRVAAGALSLLVGTAPPPAHACACGCGVFDVGTATMIPSEPRKALYLEQDYMDQDRNWIGSRSAPAALNTDKEIETWFGTLGFDDQFDERFGLAVRVPYWDRLFRTDIGSPQQPDIATYRHRALGDIVVAGRYTGFSPGLSTGISVGVKLPTGDWTYPNFDRDTEIGTGTTDLQLGAWHVGSVAGSYHLQWFAEALYDRAFNTRAGYRPGNELDLAGGMMYTGIPLGHGHFMVALLQLVGSDRLRDSGANADPGNSGYQRLLISPGAEASLGPWKVYADAEFRLYQYSNAAPSASAGSQGQLVAPVMLKVVVSHAW